jgi:hypothetical protein
MRYSEFDMIQMIHNFKLVITHRTVSKKNQWDSLIVCCCLVNYVVGGYRKRSINYCQTGLTCAMTYNASAHPIVRPSPFDVWNKCNFTFLYVVLVLTVINIYRQHGENWCIKGWQYQVTGTNRSYVSWQYRDSTLFTRIIRFVRFASNTIIAAILDRILKNLKCLFYTTLVLDIWYLELSSK